MTVSLNELRALFPTHFSRRGTANSSVDGRFWATLILENVRVVGPFWSIVITVDALSNGGSDAQVLAERVASEPAPTQAGTDVEYYPATALFLRPTGIWNDPKTVFRTPNSFGNSRISAVAAATVEANDDSALELPFVTASGDSQDSGLLPDQPEVLLQPLGRLPLQVASDPLRALTAMRLETGWIGTRARASFMANLRRALGLLEPSSDGQDLYFMPDGVGFKADVFVPWQQETISAWFRLGFHGDDATRGVLRIWRKPGADDQDAMLAKAVDRLIARMTFERGTGPQWLSLNTTRNISADRLCWPTHSEAGSILQSRNTAPECWLDGEAVELRLSAEGVSGTFTRGDGSRASVRLGTVRAGPGTGAPASSGVLDQLGLISTGVHYDAGERTLTRTLERYLPGDPDPTTWDLVTTLHGNLQSGALTLALIDIPFKHGESDADLGSFWRSKDGTWPESFIDASGMDLNHIAGFSWGVENSDRDTQDLPDGAVLHEDWVLAPHALYSAERDDPNEFRAAKIWCQVFVRSWSEAGVTFLPTSGQASVGFGRARRIGDFQNVRVPIADTAQVGGVVPTLVIDTDTATRLEYIFGGQSLEITGYLDDRGSPKVFETDPKKTMRTGSASYLRSSRRLILQKHQKMRQASIQYSKAKPLWLSEPEVTACLST